MGLSRSDLIDLFSAYGLGHLGVSSVQIIELLDRLSKTKKSWMILQEVLESNRHPVTVMKIVSKIGMVIPGRRRFGLETYRHFLENLRYYEKIAEDEEDTETKTLDLYDVYTSVKPIDLLLRYQDQDLIRLGFVPGSNRLEALQKFVREYLEIYGTFILETNSRSTYSSLAKVICYKGRGEDLRYTSGEFSALFDLSKAVVWKDRKGFGDPRPELAFHRLALHQLRQRILERFEQWRNRDGFKQEFPKDLYNILTSLDNFLVNEPRNDISAYLSNPSF